MAIDGILVVDKPAGMTSHDVVGRLRHILKERSVGHLGTLDPMATGVLPMVLGRMTRLSQFYLQSTKAYAGEIRLGFATDTYDAEGEPVPADGTCVPEILADDAILQAARALLGRRPQMPPPFSAKKIQGVPAYKLARRKQEVRLEPVKVEISEFEIERTAPDRLHFRTEVSSGTYVRSMAHELGEALGCGAHLAALRRTRSGEFQVEDAHSLEEVAEAAGDAERLAGLLIHPRSVLPEMPSVTGTPEQVGRIRHGGAVNLPEMSNAPLIKVFANRNELIAIAARVAGTLFQPKVVLSPAEP